jgi:hypothetical protein
MEEEEDIDFNAQADNNMQGDVAEDEEGVTYILYKTNN